MTSDELLPYAGLVAAVGVALLLLDRGAVMRLAGIAATVIGAGPLIAAQAPDLGAAFDRSPLFVVAALVGIGGAAILGVAGALRWPWLVPVAGLVVALRFPLANPVRPAHFLLPLYAILACGLVALAVATVRGRARPSGVGIVGLPLAAFVVYAAASLHWTFDLDRGVFALAGTFVPLGVLATLTARAVRERPFMATLPVVQVLLAAVLGIVAVYQWLTKTTFIDNPKIDIANAYSDLFRVNSLLHDPSIFGRVQVFALLTVAGLCLFGPARRSLLGVAIAVVPIFAGLVVSFSQTSFLALAAGAAVLALLAWRRTTVVVAVLGVLAVGVLLLISQPQVTSLADRSLDRATSSRAGLVERGSETFGSHPVAGVGLGGFGAATGRTAQERRQIAPHNVLVEVASELGAIGLTLFAGLLGAIVLAIRRVPGRALRAILAADLAALLTHGLGYAQFFSGPVFWAIAAIAGACAAVRVGAEQPVADAAEPSVVAPAGAST